MALQEEISRSKNEQLLGHTLKVITDRIEDGTAWGRTAYDTPEVDNEVVITGAEDGFDVRLLEVGQFYNVEINDAEAFDLFGSVKGN